MKHYIYIMLFALCTALTISAPHHASAQVPFLDEIAPQAQTRAETSAPSNPIQQRGAFAQIDQAAPEEIGLKPFASNLFEGNFARSADDGLDADYEIAAGNRIAVQTWGAVEFNEILTVDGQGNIFIPGIGPIKVGGGKAGAITERIRAVARKQYYDDFGLYANVLAVNPVGVFVTGFVTNPGRYAGIPSDSPLYYLDSAGGINAALGSYRAIDIKRGGSKIATLDLYDFVIDGTLPNIRFKDGDTIVVRKRGPVLSLLGDVAEPTMLEFTSEEIMGEDALAIIPSLVTATDITLAGMRNGQSVLRTMPLTEFRTAKLQRGDEVIVEGQEHKRTMLINLEGIHEGSKTMAVRRNMRLNDLLHHIKVDPELADLGAIHIRRKSVAASQKKVILESLHRLERSALLALSDTRGESEIRVEEAKLMGEFVARAKLVETLGNVVTYSNGAQQNILLEPDDVIVIPAISNVVQIGGEVFSSQAVAYNERLSVNDYIEMAGGYSLRADKKKVVIMRPNGETTTDRNAKIKAGDQILVPPKIDTKNVQNAIDITEILYRIALSAGVVIGL